MALVLVCLGLFAASAGAARQDGASPARAAVLPGKPALFERNDGQFSADIAFRAEFSRVSAAIHGDGSFSVRSAGAPSMPPAPVRFSLRGANQAAVARAEHPQAYRTHYFRGGKDPRQVQDVPHFARLQFDHVYPGVALAYYPANGALEYDFIVQPGGDLKKIAWKVSGAKSLKLNKEGDLIVQSASGKHVQRKPSAYQTIAGERRAVDAAFRLAANGAVGFAVGPHDKKAALVIDPVIEYASYLGGAGDDSPRAVTIGPDGSIFVAGVTRSSDFPTVGAYSARLGGASDAFVSKINPNTGALVYSTYLGDSRNADEGMGIAVDSAGAAYITGLAGAKFPTTAGSYVPAITQKSGFLTKLSPAGNTLAYSSLIPGTQPKAIAVDAQGRAAITGEAGTNFAATATAHQNGSGGDTGGFTTDLTVAGDAFIFLMNATGSAPVFATFYGGSLSDNAGGIAIDTAGNFWIAGATRSNGLSMVGAFNPSRLGPQDSYVAVFSPAGQRIAASYLVSSRFNSSVAGVAADPYGNVVVAGVSDNAGVADATLIGGSLSPVFTTTNKGYVAKLALSPLRLVFASYVGSRANNGDSVSGVTVDRAGDIHVAGVMSADVMATTYFKPIGEFLSGAAIRARYTNGDAAFAVGIQRDGKSLLYATLLAPCGAAVACSAPTIGSRLAGEVVFAGSTYADWVPIATANTRPKIAGRLPYPPDGYVMTLDLFRADLEIGTVNQSFNNNAFPAALRATAYGAVTTGNVTFADGLTVLGTAPLVEGVARLTVPLPAGIRALRATLGAVQSPVLNLPVSQANSVCP